MNILFLAPRLPLPADTGGKIRTVNILKQLARHARVHLVCFSFEPDDEKYVGATGQSPLQGITVTLVKAQDPANVIKAFNVLLHPQPHSIAKYYSEDMARTLREIVYKEPFDCIHVDHIHMAHYRDCFGSIPAVIDEHNVEYRILERCRDVEKNPLKRMLYAGQAFKMKIFEKQKLLEHSAACAVSADDRKLLEDLVDGKIATHEVPNGVDTDYFSTPEPQRPSNPAIPGELGNRGTGELSLVFTGSMDWLPNEDAVVFFCKEVLPLIWKTNPQVKFYVVGKAPSPSIKEFAQKDSRIIVTGRVDDVRPLMASAKVFVVPIRIGGGTRLKILEAMSMSKAVVSTTIGAEGIAHTNGKNIVLADKPQEFADAVLKLLSDPDQTHKLGQQGRELVLNRYDWSIIGKTLLGIYNGLTSKT